MADDAVQTLFGSAMKVVRLRPGVYGSGALVDSQGREPSRVPHLLCGEAALDDTTEVTVCCGARFAPDTLEEVPWGELWPHTPCVNRSPWPRFELETSFQAAEKTLPKDYGAAFKASFAVVDGILSSRDDWVYNDDVNLWEYTASFNGIFAGRSRVSDLGLESLVVELPRADVLRISSCGIRDGCPAHAAYMETYLLNEIGLIERRLNVHERIATSFDIHELTYCVVGGKCAQTAEPPLSAT